MKRKTVFLISREWGSGGQKIGEKLAKDLNIPFYGKETILKECEKRGFDIGLVQNEEEESKHPISYFLSMYSSTMSPYDLSVNDQVFLVQSQVIRDLAKESCVIIGRCADYILRDDPDIIRIFVYAPLKDRIKRVAEEYGYPDGDMAAKIRRVDKNRSTYYNFYTNKRWGSLENYDITVNTSLLGIDGTVELIKEVLEK